MPGKLTDISEHLEFPGLTPSPGSGRRAGTTRWPEVAERAGLTRLKSIQFHFILYLN